MVAVESIKLTELVHNPGCASKISASDLETFLSRLPKVNDPAVISGLPAGDDAGIYQLSDGTTLVQTVDVFTPCVDDPHLFGRICAANCLSDIYAMGGQPRTALSILGFPSETQNRQLMYLMLKGAMEVLAEAHCSLLGGHSIKDEEIKLGFAITGTIDAKKAVALETACVGDVLVLTKPLGVGVLNFARQIGRPDDVGLTAAECSMATLNKAAAEAMNEVGVSACTDITGFGLFGHLIRMVRRSGVTAEVFCDRLPAFPGALEALRQGIIPGAIERNHEFVGDNLQVAEGLDEALVNLGFDAQTSGGLLLAVPSQKLALLEETLKQRGSNSFVIGKIVGESSGRIALRALDQDTSVTNNEEICHMPQQQSVPQETPEEHSSDCCAEAFASGSAKSTVAEAMTAFQSMIAAIGKDGTLDARTKELILFALVVMARCGPCVELHL